MKERSNSESLKGLTLLLSSLLLALSLAASPQHARYTLLTCSPGPDLYSVFGHSAIRYQDTVRGRMVDWVFNYGTFQFSDDFYLKFARGKLDYTLSRSDFGDFQHEYLLTGRGIQEQELRLDSIQRSELYRLLMENYLPENRAYRYDFFYDNCSTRIRDIVQRATGGQAQFTYVYQQSFTFRNAIDNYLQYMPWSQFGIDLALGVPCDRVMGPGDAMFLPDSLMNEFNYAMLGNDGLAGRSMEVIPREFEPSADGIFTPHVVLGVFFLFQVLWYFFRRSQGPGLHLPDRILLFIAGCVGVLEVFLWFFTDHQATRWNLNLLWANPFLLWLAFARSRAFFQRFDLFFRIYAIALAVLLGGWSLLPQEFNPAILWLVAGMVLLLARRFRSGREGKVTANIVSPA